jgi:hypothetical protein
MTESARTDVSEAGALIGTFRRFGPVGEVYEVLAFEGEASNGEPLMRIRLPKTGEETSYALRRILDDPKED